MVNEITRNDRLTAALGMAADIAEAMGGRNPATRAKRQAARIIYLAVSEAMPGLVKIGVTANLRQRMAFLSTAIKGKATPIAAWDVGEGRAFDVERTIKRACAGRLRVQGRNLLDEWVIVSPAAMLRYVARRVGDAARIA
jgi:hypothetical protein